MNEAASAFLVDFSERAESIAVPGVDLDSHLVQLLVLVNHGELLGYLGDRAVVRLLIESG